MKNRRIVIGDVHGHYDGLMNLMEAIAPTDLDQIYFLGDLIDRGPKSSQVVTFVKNSSYRCLMGNHEEMMLKAMPNGQVNQSAWQAWLYSGGKETIESYRDTGVMPYEDLAWMSKLPSYFDLGDVWLVHAGVHPDKPINKQSNREFCWIRKEFHQSKKRFFEDKLIVTGHTITFTFHGVEPGEIVQGQGWLDIDTSAYHHLSGWLTGLDIDNRLVHQANVFTEEVRVLPVDELLKPYQAKNDEKQNILSRIFAAKN